MKQRYHIVILYLLLVMAFAVITWGLTYYTSIQISEEAKRNEDISILQQVTVTLTVFMYCVYSFSFLLSSFSAGGYFYSKRKNKTEWVQGFRITNVLTIALLVLIISYLFT